ncbi:efflux RND transporter periplasmic adaptor subunit [Hyphomicrobium sp. 2TAF46]|uniref:efflux RND transporter periplasmic adaptor subunit n=1 Tax=Hyphomicrobium sp. 2TAF46 TaxID=3233019 RepID=UPI003F8FD900
MNSLLSKLGRFTVTIVAIAFAIFAAWRLWVHYEIEPWTRDGRVRADIIAIAPDVSGLVTDVLVRDNQVVHKGDVLFRIDRDRFLLALRQAEANVEGQKATLEAAQKDLVRYQTMSSVAVSQQKVEQVTATEAKAQADLHQAEADRDVAKLNLARSEVRAWVNGPITNFDLKPGNYVTAGKGVAALIDQDSFHVDGYFEETKLPLIHVGDKATVRMMGEDRPIIGHVESIAGGIEDRDRSNGSNLLADVNPTFSWVRLAQRIPVRIALDDVPDGLRLVAGRTSTVVINPSPDDRKSVANGK